jgi:hypothetical protein
MRETLDRLGVNQWTGFGEIRSIPRAQGHTSRQKTDDHMRGEKDFPNKVPKSGDERGTLISPLA